MAKEIASTQTFATAEEEVAALRKEIEDQKVIIDAQSDALIDSKGTLANPIVEFEGKKYQSSSPKVYWNYADTKIEDLPDEGLRKLVESGTLTIVE
jgi:hypothetical protein